MGHSKYGVSSKIYVHIIDEGRNYIYLSLIKKIEIYLKSELLMFTNFQF
jgi:hypothetical protein